MALPSTLHRFDVALGNPDRGIDARFTLSAARHPSETMERLWLRLVALAWQWQEGIAFGPGLCEPEAPDVLAVGPDGRATVIIRVGKPEPERIVRDVNANAGAKVAVLFESPRRLDGFVSDARDRRLTRLSGTDLAAVEPDLLRGLAAREDRRIRVGFTFVADHVYVDLGGETLDGPLHRASL